MIDVHAHLCFPQFDKDREQVIWHSRNELDAVIVSSASHQEGVAALDLCRKHGGFLFPSLGHHPTEDPKDHRKVIRLIRENRDAVVAVGEVGLDYHWVKEEEKREAQKQVFRKFISLAAELKKPLVIHSWDAEQDCFDMVKGSGAVCIFHCFSGSAELAQEIAGRGFWVSISTNICFSKQLRKVVKAIPLGSILLETDSPFLDPDRARKRNVPWNIKLSAEKISKEIKISKEKILERAKDHAIKAFTLPLSSQV